MTVPLGINLRRSSLAIEKKPYALLRLLSWEGSHLWVLRTPLTGAYVEKDLGVVSSEVLKNKG